VTLPADFDRLDLAPEDARALGYRFIDMVIERWRTLPDEPLNRTASRAEMEALLREPVPEEPADLDAMLHLLRDEVLPRQVSVNHPRFFAFVPTPSNLVSIFAEALIAGYNPFMGTWKVAPACAQIEIITLDWLASMCGLCPGAAGGIFTSGGSMANLIALAAARHVKLGDDMTGAVLYASDQVHSAVPRALRIMGFRPKQLRVLACDDEQRLDPRMVEQAIRADRAAGLRPFCIIANAGSTNTGAVDPLPELADLCSSEDLWLHVDGAYGAAAMLTEEGRAALAGLDRADSIALDPHKWLFQPYETGVVLVRERRHLLETFAITADYMRDVIGPDEEEVNFRDYGPQLTRSFRALKVWLSIELFGLAAFRGAIQRGMDLARHAQAILESRPRQWQVVTPANLAIITFRHLPPDHEQSDAAIDAHNQRLIDLIFADETAMISSTLVAGRPVLRLCTINPRTTELDLERTIGRFEELADE